MKTTNNKPSHSIFQVIERHGAESIWNKIGAAWIHQCHCQLKTTR